MDGLNLRSDRRCGTRITSRRHAGAFRAVRYADRSARPVCAMPGEAIKHLEGKLWELRMSGKAGISRAIYVAATGRRLVVLRVFVKKTRKTPLRELELARRRAKELE